MANTNVVNPPAAIANLKNFIKKGGLREALHDTPQQSLVSGYSR